jgi:deoxyribonuclease V
VVTAGQGILAETVVDGVAGASYVPGLLALRLGPLLEHAVRALHGQPDVLFVDGTARDHPRGAGLAVHLGSVLRIPTVGVTHRPLVARGGWPDDRRGATSALSIDGQVVARWVRTQPGVRPLVVHPGWRVDLDTAVELAVSLSARRTPEPLRQARHAARIHRAAQERRRISGDRRGA